MSADSRVSFSAIYYPCNVVGYLRLAMILGAVVLASKAQAAPGFAQYGVVALLSASCLLDGLDGYLARKYEHESDFGALFDMLLDLLTQSVSWLISGFVLALPLLGLQWLTGLAVMRKILRHDGHWKSGLQQSRCKPIRCYFANRQRNTLSLFANISYTVFPMALYLGSDFALIPYIALLAIPGTLLFVLATVLILLQVSFCGRGWR